MELPLPIALSGMLLAALLIEPIASRLRIPFATLLVAFGFFASELIVAMGIDTGLRWHHFHDIVLHLLLPVLIFESALNLRLSELRKNLFAILVLAIPGVLLATGATAVLLYFGIGHAAGFPWIAALLGAAILSATDPIAVTALFRHLGVPERVTALIEGESLFNDATAIVLYAVLLPLALEWNPEIRWLGASAEFFRFFFGGLLIGLLGAGLARMLLPLFRSVGARALYTVALVTTTYYAAEFWLHVSGIMSVLPLGLVAGELCRRADDRFVLRLWELNSYMANALVFILTGVTITLAMFEERWLAMLIGIGAVLATRAALIFLLLPALARTPLLSVPPPGYAVVSFWGGLRGAVTLALALALPLEFANWWDIQSIAYGVVLFSLFVQAPTMPWLIRRTGLTGTAPPR